MSATFDLGTEDIKLSVAETIAWCAGQQLAGTAEESEEVRHRRRQGEQANELMHRAYERYQRGFWNKLFRRDYQKIREWQLGDALWRQADIRSIPLLLADQLRTPALQQSHSIGETRTEEEREDLVRSLVAKRSDLLRFRGQSTLPNVGQDLCNGRMLLYYPEENVEDGASEYASSGFFDLYDAPPWDIWVAYSDRILLSWVPPQVIELAQRGIDTNPVDCIQWLT